MIVRINRYFFKGDEKKKYHAVAVDGAIKNVFATDEAARSYRKYLFEVDYYNEKTSVLNLLAKTPGLEEDLRKATNTAADILRYVRTHLIEQDFHVAEPDFILDIRRGEGFTLEKETKSESLKKRIETSLMSLRGIDKELYQVLETSFLSLEEKIYQIPLIIQRIRKERAPIHTFLFRIEGGKTIWARSYDRPREGVRHSLGWGKSQLKGTVVKIVEYENFESFLVGAQLDTVPIFDSLTVCDESVAGVLYEGEMTLLFSDYSLENYKGEQYLLGPNKVGRIIFVTKTEGFEYNQRSFFDHTKVLEGGF